MKLTVIKDKEQKILKFQIFLVLQIVKTKYLN
jgi:hypothetical protein